MCVCVKNVRLATSTILLYILKKVAHKLKQIILISVAVYLIWMNTTINVPFEILLFKYTY